MLKAAIPTWQGIPVELKEYIIKDLNALDKASIRKVSKADLELIESLPCPIEEIFVTASSTELKVKVREPAKHSYVITDIERFVGILENPKTRIEKMRVTCGMGRFADKLEQFYSLIQEAELPSGSLHIKKLYIHSSLNFQRIEQLAPTETEAIFRILELCVPHHLTLFNVAAKLSDELWWNIVQTEQFQNAKQVEVARSQNYGIPIFESWKGKHLIVKLCVDGYIRDDLTSLPELLNIYFQGKPRGSTYSVHSFNHRASLPQRQCKINIDRSNSLYVFYGRSFVHGFVRNNDGTPEGWFNYDMRTEPRRHLSANASDQDYD